MKNPPVVERLQIRYQDLDPYGHINNAVYLGFFESVRVAYFRALTNNLGLGALEAGDVSGARFVIAEATVRYRATVYLEDALYEGPHQKVLRNLRKQF